MCTYYHETDEPPNPSQPNPRKNRLKVAIGPLFPTTIFFCGFGLVLYRKQPTRNPTKLSANTLFKEPILATNQGNQPNEPSQDTHLIGRVDRDGKRGDVDEEEEAVETGRDADDDEVHDHPPLLLVHRAQIQGVQSVLPERAHQLFPAHFHSCLLYTSPSPRD